MPDFFYLAFFEVHLCHSMYRYYIASHGWILLYCMNRPHFVYPFLHWWTFGLFVAFSYCEERCVNTCVQVFEYLFSVVLAVCPFLSCGAHRCFDRWSGAIGSSFTRGVSPAWAPLYPSLLHRHSHIFFVLSWDPHHYSFVKAQMATMKKVYYPTHLL